MIRPSKHSHSALRDNNDPFSPQPQNRPFPHVVKSATLVSQNSETAAMLVSQTNPVRVENISYANAFLVRVNFHRCWSRE